MTFYQELQLNQAGSKNLLKKSETLKEKLYHMWVYLVKIAATMAFCFFFVSIFSILFGNENSIVGVVVLLCLLRHGICVLIFLRCVFVFFVCIGHAISSCCDFEYCFFHKFYIFTIAHEELHFKHHIIFFYSYFLNQSYNISNITLRI